MKKYTALTILLLSIYTSFAQSVKKTDSAKTKAKSSKQINHGAMLRTNDIATNIAKSPELSTFYKVIQATGLNETFRTRGPVTVFVPDNQAFLNLPKGKLDSLLMPGRRYDLIALVTYHSLAGEISLRNIAHQINKHKGLAKFTTLTGDNLMAKLDENKNIVLIDEHGGKSVISRADIKQNNGVVHITDAVLIPKFKEI
jgi:uncharacterized surface protein with fasciclin (FAS1) repeats